MGIYSINNEAFGKNYEVAADESYVGTEGGLIAMLDIQRNNHAIFESLIARDFQEAYMIHEGASDEELISFNEASIGGIIDKIKAGVKKIWEKVKGIFKNFIAKIDGIISRDTKELVKKYHKTIVVKDLSKVKYKFSKPLAGFNTILNELKADTAFKKYTDMVFGKLNDDWNGIKAIGDKIRDGEYKDEIVTAIFTANLKLKGFNDFKSLKKDMHEACFDTKYEEEGVSNDTVSYVESVLNGQADDIKDIKKMQTAADKHFNALLKEIDRVKKEFADNTDKNAYTVTYGKGMVDKPSAPEGNLQGRTAYAGTKEAIVTGAKRASTLHDAILNIQTVYTQTVSYFLDEIKFNVAQCKKLYMKLATYNDKKAKNEAFEMYLDAVAEAAEYEFYSDFDEIDM